MEKAIDLSEREKQLLILFLDHQEAIPIDEIARRLTISQRSTYSKLSKLSKKLLGLNIAPPRNVRGSGYYLPPESREQIRKWHLGNSVQPRLRSSLRRQLIFWQFFAAKQHVTINQLAILTGYSRNTIINDLAKLRQELATDNLEIVGDQHGLQLVGTELMIRRFADHIIHPHDLFPVLISRHDAAIATHYEQIANWLRDVQQYMRRYFSDDAIQQICMMYSGISERIQQGKTLSPGTFPHSDYTRQQMISQVEYEFARDRMRELGQAANQDEVCYLEGMLLSSTVKQAKSEAGGGVTNTYVRQLTKQIIKTFKQLAQVSFADEDKLEADLFRHLLATYYRVKTNRQVDDKLAKQLKVSYQDVYLYTKMALGDFARFVGTDLNESEIGLISMYFGAELYKQRTKKQTALLVCSAGIGTSYFLKAQLEATIPELVQHGPITKYEYQHLTTIKEDVVLSTVSIETKNKPVILVDSVLSEGSVVLLQRKLIRNGIVSQSLDQRLSALLDVIEANTQVKNYEALVTGVKDILSQQPKSVEKGGFEPLLSELLTDKTIRFAKVTADLDWQRAIALAADPLVQGGEIKPAYIDEIVANVNENGPYINIGPGVALAHAQPGPSVNNLGMSLLVLDRPINLVDDQHPIQLILVLAAVDSKSHLKALSELTQILGDNDKLQVMMQATNAETIEQLIKEGE